LTEARKASGRDPGELAHLEDEVGWELGEVLENPDMFEELPAVALADIGGRFGIDWRSFFPPAG
jgi:hypothetical protein